MQGSNNSVINSDFQEAILYILFTSLKIYFELTKSSMEVAKITERFPVPLPSFSQWLS